MKRRTFIGMLAAVGFTALLPLCKTDKAFVATKYEPRLMALFSDSGDEALAHNTFEQCAKNNGIKRFRMVEKAWVPEKAAWLHRAWEIV